MAISILLACFVALGVFLAFQGMTRPQTDLLEARLAQFGERDMTLEEIEMTMPFTDRFLRPILDRFGAIFAKNTPAKQREELQEKINIAGRPYGLTVGMFMSSQFIALVAGAALGLGLTQ